MTENSEKLRTTLTELHEQLRQAHSVDPQTRDLLRAILADIQATLAGSTAEPARPQEEHATHIDRLAEAARHFEASHPTLSGTVSRLIDILQQIGI
jgi:hypothetical protein